MLWPTCEMYLSYKLKILLLSMALITETAKHCYQMKILTVKVKDTWKYSFKMLLHRNQTLSSVSIVREEVTIPMWGAVIIQNTKGRRISKSDKPKVLFNGSYIVCEFLKTMKRYRLLTNYTNLMVAKNTGNMSLACPLKVGTYVIKNIFVAPDSPGLRYMYWPNTIYTAYGAVYSQHKNKSMETLVNYEVNCTVSKTC